VNTESQWGQFRCRRLWRKKTSFGVSGEVRPVREKIAGFHAWTSFTAAGEPDFMLDRLPKNGSTPLLAFTKTIPPPPPAIANSK
jgi:hypothetical protein